MISDAKVIDSESMPADHMKSVTVQYTDCDGEQEMIVARVATAFDISKFDNGDVGDVYVEFANHDDSGDSYSPQSARALLLALKAFFGEA